MLCVVYCVRMCVVVGVLSRGVLYILYIRREAGGKAILKINIFIEIYICDLDLERSNIFSLYMILEMYMKRKDIELFFIMPIFLMNLLMRFSFIILLGDLTRSYSYI